MNGETSSEKSKKDKSDNETTEEADKAKVLGGEVIRKWKSTSRHGGTGSIEFALNTNSAHA